MSINSVYSIYVPEDASKNRFCAARMGELGIYVTAGIDDDGQPYVSVNTEDMSADHTYDETTGLRGDARPYEVITPGMDGTWADVVAPWPSEGGPAPDHGSGSLIARHYGSGREAARLAAQKHAEMLNDLWPTCCGMPIISVRLGDKELYDARDHGAPKTEEAS